MFDQWVPDEPAPRRVKPNLPLGEVGGAALQVVQGLLWNVAWTIWHTPGAVRSGLVRLRRGELGSDFWAHAAGVACAVLVVGTISLVPERAQSHRANETLRLFRLTGGDLSDDGMTPLVKLDRSAAGIAFRVSPLTGPQRLSDTSDANDPAQNPPVLNMPGMTPDEARMLNAALPFSGLPVVPAKPFFLPPTDLLDQARAVDCLTAAVYYEAASESTEGQQAVAQVVLNRVRNKAFPKTVCGVVFQGSQRRTGCQFSFTCDGSLYRKPSDRGWARAREVSIAALGGFVFKPVGDATHYHADYVAPYWSTSMIKITKIGAHIFYRWTGELGQPRSFDALYNGGEPLFDLGAMDLSNPQLDISMTVPTGAVTLTTDMAAPVGTDDGTAQQSEGAAEEAPKVELTVTEPVVAPIETPAPEAKKPPPPAKRGEWRRLPTARTSGF